MNRLVAAEEQILYNKKECLRSEMEQFFRKMIIICSFY